MLVLGQATGQVACPTTEGSAVAFPLWLRVAGTGFWESEDLAWFSAWLFSVWGPGFLQMVSSLWALCLHPPGGVRQPQPLTRQHFPS